MKFTTAFPLPAFIYVISLCLIFSFSWAIAQDENQISSRLEWEKFTDRFMSLYREGRFDEAFEVAKEALQLAQKEGVNHPFVAKSLVNLALFYSAQGMYEQAESLYIVSLAILEDVLGPDHPDVGASLNNLAELYRAQGQYAQAELPYKRSLTIRENALGPDHPDVAISLNNLGMLYYSQGQYAQAEPLYKRSLTILEMTFGPDHPIVAKCLENLATLYRKAGQEKEAEVFEKRAEEIWQINNNMKWLTRRQAANYLKSAKIRMI